MIFENPILDISVIGGTIFLLSLISFFSERIKDVNKRTRLWQFFVISALPTLVVSIAILNRSNYSFLSWLSLVIILLDVFYVIWLYINYTLVDSSGFRKVLAILIVPIALLIPNTVSWFNSNQQIFDKFEVTGKTITGDIDLKKLEDSFSKIKNLNKDLESNMAKELESINKSIDDIYVEIENKKEQLEIMKQKEAEYKREIEYLNFISTLSKSDIQAIKKSMNPDKIEGYIVGAITGILTSILGSIIIGRKPLRRIL